MLESQLNKCLNSVSINILDFNFEFSQTNTTHKAAVQQQQQRFKQKSIY